MENNRENEELKVIRRRKNFTMIDNSLLENNVLSWKAKGILSYLLSRPDGWSVIINDLRNRSKDGVDSIKSGLKELEQHGYYYKIPVKNEKGIIVKWASFIFEYPEDNKIFIEQQKEKPPKKKVIAKPFCPQVDFPLVDNPPVENPLHNNTNTNNTKYINKSSSSAKKEPEKKEIKKPDDDDKKIKDFDNLIFEYLNKNIDFKTLKTLSSFFKDAEELENILKIAKDQPNIKNINGWLLHASKNKDNYTTENYVNTSNQSAVKKNSFTNYTGRAWDYDEIAKLEREYVREQAKDFKLFGE